MNRIATPDGGRNWRIMLISLLLAAMVWAVFAQSLNHAFVNYDDEDYVTENPAVSGGLSREGIRWAFTSFHASNWHPLTWMSHMLDCQWYGLKPAGHHLTSILLHMATTILLFQVLRLTTGALWRSAFAAALFAVHPLRVESVAWVAERKDVLGGFFFMLTLWAYARYVQGRSRREPDGAIVVGTDPVPDSKTSAIHYALALLFFIFGLMSKPMLVTLPFVLLLLDAWPLRRFDRSTVRHLLIEKIPFIALSVAVCIVTLFAQQDVVSGQPISLRIGNALQSYVVYLRQFFYPARLAVLYPFSETGPGLWNIAAALAVLLVISVGAVAVRRKRPWVLMGWLWYLGMLIPVIGIVQVGIQAHADRYTYLPMIGLHVLLAWTVAEFCADWRVPWMVPATSSAIVLSALLICARTQVSYWRDSESLWTRTLVCTPDCIGAQVDFGNYLLKKGRTDDGMTHFQRALQLNQNIPDAHVGLGYALIQKGLVDEGIVHLERASELAPADPEIHNHLGNVLALRGRSEDAVAHLQKAVQLKPDFAEAHYCLGNALFEKGNVSQAILHLRAAVKSNPDYLDALNNLAWILATAAPASLRNGNEAVNLVERANRLSGGKDLDVLGTLAAAYAEAGRFDEARQTAKQAIELAQAAGELNQVAQLKDQLELYSAKQPFHQVSK